MTATLASIETNALHPAGLRITGLLQDAESEDYDGLDLLCNGSVRIKYRQAKLTPKKAGNFVALWKRSASGGTAPFTLSDPFDFYMIAVHGGSRSGFFMFPRQALAGNGVLTNGPKEGKRGFRLYPGWVEAPNRQALNTQQWQSGYFVDLDEKDAAARLRRIIHI
ncbi:MepB family protein [Chitinophaga rhizosphaerae]|uniref:MepB family protein n=1 Tax=Chitinophaga rhizosphaerae TaxID=1864947 RepID=UPI000F7FAF34|nr:MepB family protein [Chitinophaga rhizosphaerae]